MRLTRIQILRFSNKNNLILVFRLSDRSGIHYNSVGTSRSSYYFNKKSTSSKWNLIKLDMSGLPMEKHGAQARLFWMSWLTVSLSFSYLRMRTHHALIYGNRVRYNRAGNLSPAMGARNQVGIGLSYRPASLCSMATQFQTWFLESIPRPIAGLKFFYSGRILLETIQRSHQFGSQITHSNSSKPAGVNNVCKHKILETVRKLCNFFIEFKNDCQC